jgi:acetyltransferase-like isoleucine patch superfamily enzyme
MNFIKTILYKIIYLCGFVVHIFSKMRSYYENQKISQQLGGGARTIQYPYRISGAENIECGESVNIGKGSVIMCLRSKLIIKGHFVSGPNLTIIAGDHMSVVGMYLDNVSD